MTRALSIAQAALLIIDVQQGFDDARWGQRNNPQAEANVARLLALWREVGGAVVHVHHESSAPDGSFRPGTPGNRPKPEAMPHDGERVVRKRVNSAFIGTDLEAMLRTTGLRSLVLVGLTTNHCVSTTARMAGNLGFDTHVVSDATAAFDRRGLDGRNRPAADVHAAALSDLSDEFATIVDTAEIVTAFGRGDA